MPSDTPIHDFLNPRLTALVREAEAQGFQRDIVVAVLIDLITAPRMDTAAPAPTDDSAPHPDYQRSPDVVLVHGSSAANPPAIGGTDEADFVQPLRWDR